MAEEKEAPKRVSRRQFVKGAAAVAGVGALASCAPPATPAPGETAAPAPTCPPAAECAPCPTVEVGEVVPEEAEEAKPIPPVDPPAAWDKEADIVVVGGGGAGLSAGLKAADKGNAVIVLEKTPSTGGSTQYSTGSVLWGTRVQERAGYVFNEEEFDKVYEKELIASNYTVDQVLLGTIIRKSGQWGNWMEDLGYEFEPFAAGAPVDYHMPIGGRSLRHIGVQRASIDWLVNALGEKGGEVLVKTQAVALVKENGRIVGVQAESDGQPLFVKAKKAVILAANGFCNNRDLLEKHIPAALYGCGSTYDMPSSTGEAFRMGLGAGADVSGLNTYQAFDGGIPYFDMGIGTWHHFLYQGDTQMIRQPWLNVSRFAERFTYVDKGQKMFKARIIAAAPGGRAYVVFDGNFETNYKAIEGGG
jgi:fumarate reductase flavoprotein subunit